MNPAITDSRPRPPGWWEAIAAALRAAPEPSPELCEKVAGLLLSAEPKALIHRQSRGHEGEPCRH